MNSPVVKAALRGQNSNGFWGPADSMYYPKYRGTTHSLLVLAEMGATRTKKIEQAINHLFSFQRDSGHFLINLPKTAKGRASIVTDGCCLDGNILYYLNHFGYLEDPRTKKLIAFLIKDHSEENGGVALQIVSH